MTDTTEQAADTDLTVSISAGSVEYSLDAAAVPIADLIALLEEAQEDGAEYVVGLSGNYRGAQYVRLGTSYEWLDQ